MRCSLDINQIPRVIIALKRVGHHFAHAGRSPKLSVFPIGNGRDTALVSCAGDLQLSRDTSYQFTNPLPSQQLR